LPAAVPAHAGGAKEAGSAAVGPIIRIIVEFAIEELKKDRTYSNALDTQVVLGELKSSQTLIVCVEERARVQSYRGEKTFRGWIHVTLRVPCNIHYVVKLDALRVEDLHYDAAAKRLYVRAPEVCLGPIESLLGEMTREMTYTGMRFRFYDSGTADLLQQCCQQDILPRAQAHARGRIPEVQEKFAPAAVRQHVERVIRVMDPSVSVVIR
jgi:hypothetical protein